jgi:UDP-N-acetylmuramoylalanine--D-glutamate ligase
MAEEVEEALRGADAAGVLRVRRAGDLEAAVRAAWELSRPGDVVLLSPGGTSFDAFRDFEARGSAFKEIVRGLSDGG